MLRAAGPHGCLRRGAERAGMTAIYQRLNGKLRLVGISTVRDRVCMTAALLVLEPIFEADLPPEIYAYRAGETPSKPS
jgi:hypothetical protein